MKQLPRGMSGFNLTELMVVIAIVGILVAVSYPSYQEQVQSGRRSDAKAELMRLAQYMERVYTESGCYNPGTTGICGAGSPISTDDDGRIPVDVEGYELTFSEQPTADSFTIMAAPIEGGAQDGDGFLEIDELGSRTWDENNDTEIGAGEDDWERG